METNLPRVSSAPSEGVTRTQSNVVGELDVASTAHTQFLRLLQQILESMVQAGTVSLRKVLNKIFEDYAYMLLDDMISIITMPMEHSTIGRYDLTCHLRAWWEGLLTDNIVDPHAISIVQDDGHSYLCQLLTSTRPVRVRRTR